MDKTLKGTLIICAILVGLKGISNVIDQFKGRQEEVAVTILNNAKTGQSSKITTYEKVFCEKEKKLYYTDDNGINYYTSCLNKIAVDFGYGETDLIDALYAKKITFNEIYSMSEKAPIVYYDGGSKEYSYDNFTIIKCNSLSSIKSGSSMDASIGKDVIIGKKDLDINDYYCHEDFENPPKSICRFTRTYLVNKITNNERNGYTEVVVSQYGGGIATVNIENRVIEYLKENKYMEFHFDNNRDVKLYEAEDNIKFIFENYDLGAYGSESELSPLEQIQDPLCENW